MPLSSSSICLGLERPVHERRRTAVAASKARPSCQPEERKGSVTVPRSLLLAAMRGFSGTDGKSRELSIPVTLYNTELSFRIDLRLGIKDQSCMRTCKGQAAMEGTARRSVGHAVADKLYS